MNLENNIIVSYRGCPVCGEKSGLLLHTQNFGIKTAGVLPEVYNILQCSCCKMVYSDMDAQESDFSLYYDTALKYTFSETAGAGGELQSDLIRFRNVVQYIKPWIQPDSSIVDIGSGRGGLLRAFLEEGYRDLTALDANPQCLDYIKRQLGIKTVFSDLSEKISCKKFDLILSTQLFEHLFCPKAVLKRISDILKDDGLLYIDVPDASRYHECYVSPYHYFDVEHINHFSAGTLKHLLLQNGFDMLECSSFLSNPGKNIFYPCVRALARKRCSMQKEEHPLSEDDISAAISLYLNLSGKDESEKKKYLEREASGQTPVFIWGIGAYCRRMLASGIFDTCNLQGLIDRDPSMTGQTIHGAPVLLPETLRDRGDCLFVITAVLYKTQILEQLSKMNFHGKKIILC